MKLMNMKKTKYYKVRKSIRFNLIRKWTFENKAKLKKIK